MLKRSHVGLGALALLCMTTTAHAQDASAAAGPSAAEKLYEEGLQAMLANDFASGCPTLQRSYEADPKLGALFTVAACYERWGKLHTAVLRYEQYVNKAAQLPPDEASKQAERLKTAAGKLDELRPKIPTLTVAFSSPPPSGTRVSIDGSDVDLASLGSGRPLDPGEHRVMATDPDGKTHEETVTLAVSGSETVTFDLGEAPAPKGSDEPAPERESSGDGSALETAAFVVGGLGLAGIIVGSVTGGLVFAKKSTVKDNCNENNVCTQEGKDAADQAKTLGLVSTVTFAVGGAALAAGVLMFVLAPDDKRSAEARGAGDVRIAVGASPGDQASAVLLVHGWW